MNAENNSSDNRTIDKDAKTGKSDTQFKASKKSGSPFNKFETNISELQAELAKFKDIISSREKLDEYIDDLKDELSDIKLFRKWITRITVGFSLSLFGIFFYFSLFPPCWFSELEGNIKIPFLISLSVMSVLLMSLCLRGVYQARKERNYGDFLPESLHTLLKGSGVDTP